MEITVEKIPGGFRIDGIDLKNGKCGCTSIAKCCYSWSKVKVKGSMVEFVAKLTTADSQDHFGWSYVVRKNGTTVRVNVEDARDKDTSSAYLPPPVSVWEEKGWEVVEREGDREDGVVWRCATCKWLFKENEQQTKFEDLPGDWKCPVCNAPKTAFEQIG